MSYVSNTINHQLNHANFLKPDTNSSASSDALQTFSHLMEMEETPELLKLATTTVIEFTEGVGHAALHIDDDGTGEAFLYDPAGAYMPENQVRGTGDFFSGDAADLDKYVEFWKERGEEAILHKLETTPEQEQEIIDRAIEIGGAAPFFCADSVSTALGGVCGIEGSFFPSRLGDQAEDADCK